MSGAPARRLAVVTGASSGIGESFSRKLAGRGYDLVLAARSKDRLDRLAGELSERHGVSVETVAVDLSAPGAARTLFDAAEGSGRAVDLLVNNAGFGLNGAQADLPLEKVSEMLRLDVVAVVELSHLFLVAMRARRRGRILNVASTQAFLPMPFMAAYGASKAFIVSFSQALHEEAKRDGVIVTCVCPGYTKTAFQAVSGMRPADTTPFPEMRPDDVAEVGLVAVERGRALVVTHPLDRLWIFTMRFLPRSWPAKVAGAIFAKRRR